MAVGTDPVRLCVLLAMGVSLAASANSGNNSSPPEPEPEVESEPIQYSSNDSPESAQDWSPQPTYESVEPSYTSEAAGCGDGCDDPGTACGNLIAEAQAGSLAASYLSAACLCACHLQLGGCGTDVAFLQQCVDENTVAANNLGSEAPVISSDPWESPEPDYVPTEPTEERWECTGPAADQRCVLVDG